MSNPTPVPVPMPGNERQLLRWLALLQFTHLLDYMILMPLGGELMRDFGVQAGAFGLLVGVYTLASAAAGLLGSFWLDRLDRRSALLKLYAGFILATLGCALAPNYVALLAARALAGACAGLMAATLMSLIADLVEPQRRGQAMGIVMSAFGACAVVGVPLGLGLAAWGGWRLPFACVVLLSLCVWIVLWRRLPAVPVATGPRSGLVDILRQPRLVLGWLLTFGIVFAGFLIVPYLGAHLSGNLGVSLPQLSAIYCLAGLATFFASRRIGRAVDRFGASRLLLLLMAASLVPHLWMTHLQTGPLALTMLVFALFMVLTSTRAIPASTWLVGRVPPPLRGRYMAINTAFTEASAGLAAATTGWIVSNGDNGQLLDFGAVGWLSAGFTVSSLLLLWVLHLADARRPSGAAVIAST